MDFHRRTTSTLGTALATKPNVYSGLLGCYPQAAEHLHMAEISNFSLPALLVFRLNAVAEKADVDVHAIVEQALDNYFANNRDSDQTLPPPPQSPEDDAVLRDLDYS